MTRYSLIINHGDKETRAFYSAKVDAVRVAIELLKRGKVVNIECLLYDRENNLIKKSIIF